MKSIEQLLPRLQPGETVLLRADLNVPLEGGKVSDSNRIEAALPTLQLLTGAGARVVLMTHLGRPDGADPSLSTAVVAAELQRLLDSDVTHIAEFPPSDAARSQVASASPGSVAMLENLRFDRREVANDLDFARALAAGAQHYVNDAFGCCHRAHASVDAITGLLPSYAGLLVEREVAVLGRLRDRADRPFWLIAGGAKVKDKIGVLAHLSDQLDGVVCGGGLANTLLQGKGIPVGDSRTEPAALAEVQKRLEGDTEVVLPVDFIAGDDALDPTDTVVVRAGDAAPAGYSFYDIGPDSIELFRNALGDSSTIFWNGPLGVFESAHYARGPSAICQFLASHSGTVVIGGGDSAAAARLFGIADAVDHVSTGGGAALQLLEGSTLPGIDALERSHGQVDR